ncbi:response regulator [Vibrio cincinnatiensis]|nr:response regulator [Vibrio cincinnatiensis]
MRKQVIKATKVIVADDSSLVLSNIKLLLREIGFSSQNIYTAKDSKSLIKILSEEKIELIVCDFNFGDDMNGKQIYEEIQYLGLTPPWCTFIMLTGEKQGDTVKSIVDIEPDDYIVKPYSVHLVKNRILRAFYRKLALREMYTIPLDSSAEDIISIFEFTIAKNPQYESFLKRLAGESLLKFGYSHEAKALFLRCLQEGDHLWAMYGFINSCLVNGDYNDAFYYLNEWEERNLRRSPKLHECMAKLYLVKGDSTLAFDEIKSAFDKAQNMDRLLNFARICEVNGVFDKAYDLFAMYRSMSQGTYRESLVNNLWLTRAILFRTQLDSPDKSKVMRIVKKEIREMELGQELSVDLSAYLPLLDMHGDWVMGSYRQFREKLYSAVKSISSASLDVQIYCARLALLGQQVELCYSLLKKISPLTLTDTEFETLLPHAQVTALLNECQSIQIETKENWRRFKNLLQENRVQMLRHALDCFHKRSQCPQMALMMLKAMEYGFPPSLSASRLREMIFSCEQTIETSYILSKEEILAARQSLHKVKVLFNAKLAQ